MNTLSTRAAIDIAESCAADAMLGFNLSAARVWIVTSDGNVLLAASHGDRSPAGALDAGAVFSAIDAGPVLTGRRMGVPLRNGSIPLGYIECFSVSPISFAEAGGIEAWSAGIAEGLAALGPLPPGNRNRGHVLIADDDPSIRKLLETVLGRSGYTVTSAEDGQRAYELAQQVSPDLVLLDWMMPILDGRSAAARLKSDPQTSRIPVVMLTSQSSTEDKVAALEAGAQDYLTKPFDPRELVARIEQQLRWRTLLGDAPASTPAAPPQGAAAHAASDDTDDAPPPPNGDYWSAAVQAQQVGKHRRALAYYLFEAEKCDGAREYARAAIAFRSASAIAGQLQRLDLSNKLLRLSGKMYLCWAESAKDDKSMQEAYVNAARSFLAAGNLKLARKSVEIAESMQSVIADDRPSPLA